MLTTPRLRPLLLAALAVALCVPGPAAADGARAAAAVTAYAPGEVVVRYERSADRSARARVQRETGVGAPEVFAPRTRVLTIRDGESVAATVRELRARPEVATAAPNVKRARSAPSSRPTPATPASSPAGRRCSGTSCPARGSTRPTRGST